MMSKPTIAGIQQVGIGIPNVHEAFKWYRQNFGMDIPIFEEAAEANLMLPYTGGKPHMRHAILAINMKGGGGFEIWQYTSRTPEPCSFELQIGDLGFYCARMKTSDVKGSYEFLKAKKANIVSELTKDAAGNDTFYVRDPWNNLFQVVKSTSWFGKGLQLTGGPAGMMVGVSDIEKSKAFYADILGYDTVVYDKE
jgi:catechol 2,3-dioxygenase-like lactoylglutathione lyase family enzyme